MNTFSTQLRQWLSAFPAVAKSLQTENVATSLHCERERLLPLIAALREHLPKLRLANFFATDDRAATKTFGLRVILVEDAQKQRIIIETSVPEKDPSIATLSSVFVGSARFEREMWDLFGIVPLNHPELKPLIAHEHWPADFFPLRKDVSLGAKPTPTPNARPYAFKRYEGEGIYEIPVGPIHAGVIEPGHFRFQVAGEPIQNLEIRLGWKHRGVEKLFEHLPLEKTVRLSEQVSGDNSVAHSVAFCMAVENATQTAIPKRAQGLRMIFLELERINTHLHDLANINVGIGFNFGASQLWILREQLLQLNDRLTGNRFLRGVNCLGGVKQDLSTEQHNDLLNTLKSVITPMDRVLEIILDSPSCLDRLQTTGVLHPQIIHDLGVVGLAARASGIARDVRKDFPYLHYANMEFDTPTRLQGDVFSRFVLRQCEIHESMRIIEQSLADLAKGKLSTVLSVKNASSGYAMVETNRGELQYWVRMNGQNGFDRVKICDPAFHNWDALALCVQGNIIPDFPLCNKSFNLSYAGHDL